MDVRRYRTRAGLFGIGLDAYWPQFPGLEDRLRGYLGEVADRLAGMQLDVVDLGLVDSPRKAVEAGHRARQSDIDILFLYVTTYALSATVLPVVRRARVPVIVLNLAPGASIDYAAFNRMGDRTRMTGEWLASCQACPVPELANVFSRCGIPFHQVTGMLDGDPAAWEEIEGWAAAARVAGVMEHNRLGIMGHYYGGMLDIYTDLTRQCGMFGGHMEMIEVEELRGLRAEVKDAEIAARVTEFNQAFDMGADCATADVAAAARTSLALDRLVERHELGSLAYFYSGTDEGIASIILGNSLLTARGIPVAGEMEIKNAQAMKIMDAFGAGGSFTEFYAMDFVEDVVLMGHDGPGHLAIAQGKPRVRPLSVYHGKSGRGLSVEMSVRHGPVTLLSVTESGFVVAEGESVTGPILEIGNTNSRYRFAIGARRFVSEWSARGPAHHCAVGTGHIAARIEQLAKLLGVDCARVGGAGFSLPSQKLS